MFCDINTEFYDQLDDFIREMKKKKETKILSEILKDLSKVLHNWEWLENGDPAILHDVERWKSETQDRRQRKFDKSFNKFKKKWLREVE